MLLANRRVNFDAVSLDTSFDVGEFRLSKFRLLSQFLSVYLIYTNTRRLVRFIKDDYSHSASED